MTNTVETNSEYCIAVDGHGVVTACLPTIVVDDRAHAEPLVFGNAPEAGSVARRVRGEYRRLGVTAAVRVLVREVQIHRSGWDVEVHVPDAAVDVHAVLNTTT